MYLHVYVCMYVCVIYLYYYIYNLLSEQNSTSKENAICIIYMQKTFPLPFSWSVLFIFCYYKLSSSQWTCWFSSSFSRGRGRACKLRLDHGRLAESYTVMRYQKTHAFRHAFTQQNSKEPQCSHNLGCV